MERQFIRTVEDFRRVVQIGHTSESILLDFKRTLDPRTPGWQVELARDISQFANTAGGCLLIGIEERRDSVTGLKVAGDIRPVADADGVRGLVEQAIANFLVPSTLSREVSFIRVAEGTLVAVNIYPSRNLVHVWSPNNHTIECLHRTNHGKGWMNPDEMERHMMNGSRAIRLAFQDARESARDSKVVEVVGGVWRRLSGNLKRVEQPDFVGEIANERGDCFELAGTVHASNPPERLNVTIPFDLVRCVWVDSGGRLSVLLQVRLLYTDHSLTFEAMGN